MTIMPRRSSPPAPVKNINTFDLLRSLRVTLHFQPLAP